MLKVDLLVIGSGPAGQKAALQAAKAGKKAAIVEKYPKLGGGCVHFGTLPSKSLRESVYRWAMGSKGTMRIHKNRGSDFVLPDLHRLWRRARRVAQNESEVIYDQLKRNSIKIIQGHGKILSKNRVEVTSDQGVQEIETDVIVIATGAGPIVPENLMIDKKLVFDSDTILELRDLPKKMIIVGAGIIGCEYASMFAVAGVKVYIIDKREEILASVDREIVDHLIEHLQEHRAEIFAGVNIENWEKVERKVGDGKKPFIRATLSDGTKIHGDVALIAQGRQGNTDGLGLENVGIQRNDRHLIPVNEFFQTSSDRIYAAGDVIGHPALASTGFEQGRRATCHAFGVGDGELSDFFPYGIYTIPEISMIGKTQEELEQEGVAYVSGIAKYRELARGQIVGDEWGILKILADQKTLKILGIHIIGDNAAELIHIGQAVMDLEGDLRYFIRHVFNYPTLAEAYKVAAFHAVNQIKNAN